MSIRLKLALLLLVLFFAAIGNAMFTFLLDSYGEEKLTWVIHTHKVLTESERLLGAMTDAETGQRGYLLTRNSEYLEPYHIGLVKSKEHLEALIQLTSDNPKQQQRLRIISSLMERKVAELAQTIELAQQNTEASMQEAMAIVNSNSGKRFMEAIRVEVLAFNNAEQLLLEQRNGAFKESRAYITAVVGFEVLFFIFMAVITALFIRSKLYQPLSMLIEGTAKMERGEKQEVADFLPNDEMGYLLSRFYRMSEVVHSKAEALDYEASHDALTGLKNRAKLELELEDTIASLKNNEKIALMFMDLNKFKILNDTLGHDVGDAVLVETAKRLQDSVRSDDDIYRLGGDEFIIVIKNITCSAHVELVAENMLESFSREFVFQGHDITISPSIGIALAPDHSSSGEKIIRLADVAMYAAKQGEGEYRFYDDSMLKRISDRNA